MVFWLQGCVCLEDYIIASPQRVKLYVQAAVSLHNFLRTTESGVYCPPGFINGEDGSGNLIDGGWRQDEETNSGMKSISQAGSNYVLHIVYIAFLTQALSVSSPD